MPRQEQTETLLFSWGRDDRNGVRSLRVLESISGGIRFEVKIGGRSEGITIPRNAREDLGVLLLRPREEPGSER